jgi:hypothetical protein
VDAFDAFLAANPEHYEQFEITLGHHHINDPVLRRSPRRLVVMAVFREPIARAISHYNYIRGRADHPLHTALLPLTLGQALAAVPEFRADVCNAQVRRTFGTELPEAIPAAMARHPHILGRFDQIPRFLATVAKVTGRPVRKELPWLNRAPALPGLEPTEEQPDYTAALAALAVANAADQQFYASLPEVLVTH